MFDWEARLGPGLRQTTWLLINKETDLNVVYSEKLRFGRARKRVYFHLFIGFHTVYYDPVVTGWGSPCKLNADLIGGTNTLRFLIAPCISTLAFKTIC